MKRMCLIVMAAWGVAGNASATLILDEPFNYPDGVLTNVSDGVWLAHSPTAGPVDVVSGRVRLAASDREDVNRPLSGGSYTNGILYASFAVNFSALPNSAGNFFAHFNSGSFRGRVFATTAGAPAGKFRVGIANGASSPSPVIATDLSLGQAYRLVMRVGANPAASTLWIDPSSEASLNDRGDAADATTAAPLSAFALRQDSGIGTLTVDDLKIGTAFAEVVSGGTAATNPPVIGALPDQSIPANASTPALAFSVNDGETPAADLVVTATSSNPTLVPNAPAHLALGGGDIHRTITVVPAPGEQGRATIVLTVRDGDGNLASIRFEVVVGAPGISPIPNQITRVGQPTPAVPFLIGDGETPSADLALSGSSSQPALVPDAGIAFGGSGSNRTVTVTPTAGQSGLAYVTVTVSDGLNTAATTFAVSVNPFTGTDLVDRFNYGDGPLALNSSFVWARHSGGTNELQIQGGRVQLSQAQTEDVHALFLGPPQGVYTTNSGYVIYSSLAVQFTELPAGTGNFFAHLTESGNVVFRAQIFATTNGAAPGHYRLGIANGSSDVSAIHPHDLAQEEVAIVTTRYTVDTAETVLWVNALAESDEHVAATDVVAPVDINAFAFRQADGIGVLAVDDLITGGTFEAVRAEPAIQLEIKQSGSLLQISWPASPTGYVLQSTTALPSGWSDYTDQGTAADGKKTVMLPSPAGTQLFRLAK